MENRDSVGDAGDIASSPVAWEEDATCTPAMLRELDSKLISSDLLAAELVSIQEAIKLLEEPLLKERTVEIQTCEPDPEVLFSTLASFHKRLQDEYYDFLIASQHKSASNELRLLPEKYEIPKRIWRYGIYGHLEFLRHRLPGSNEHLLTFLNTSYTFMMLLYETVPSFEEAWMECLGDLSRYRMALEPATVEAEETRHIWRRISRSWYVKASDKTPQFGRIYHNLAILAQPEPLQQIFYFAKALCAPNPCPHVIGTILMLLKPRSRPSLGHNLPSLDELFVHIFIHVWLGEFQSQLHSWQTAFLGLLESHISGGGDEWSKPGCYMAVSLSCLVLGLGDGSSVLVRAIQQAREATDISPDFETAVAFSMQTFRLSLTLATHDGALPFLHTTLVFYLFLAQYPAAMIHVHKDFPWQETCQMLNSLCGACTSTSPCTDGDEFPGLELDEQPLPEDYALRGLLYTTDYFPPKWFDKDENDEEPASIWRRRRQRILWVGRQIAKHHPWLIWNANARHFSVSCLDQV